MTDPTLEQFREDFGLSGEARPAKPEDPRIQRHRWGLFPDVDIAAYHAGFIPELTLSQSGIKILLNKTPLEFAFQNRQLNPDAERLAESVAMYRGDVVHQLALGKGDGYAVLDYDDFRSGDAKKAKARAIEDGLTPIKRSAFEEAEIMAEVVRDRIHEALDGASYETEVAFLYQEVTPDGPIWVRGLLDVWCEELGVILDPKISAQLHSPTLERHMINMGWDLQAALYSRAVGEILGKAGHIKFANLIVSPDEPFVSRSVRLEKAWHWSAVKQCTIGMSRFAACASRNEWPSYDGIDTIELPVWEAKKREALELAEGA